MKTAMQKTIFGGAVTIALIALVIVFSPGSAKAYGCPTYNTYYSNGYSNTYCVPSNYPTPSYNYYQPQPVVYQQPVYQQPVYQQQAYSYNYNYNYNYSVSGSGYGYNSGYNNGYTYQAPQYYYPSYGSYGRYR